VANAKVKEVLFGLSLKLDLQGWAKSGNRKAKEERESKMFHGLQEEVEPRRYCWR